MAITDYVSLQNAMTNWLGTGINSALYSDFITLFESDFNRTMRLRQMEAKATLTFTGALAPLPADFLHVEALIVATGELEFVTPLYLEGAYVGSNTTSNPEAYTIIGSDVLTGPACVDGTIATLTYYAKVPELSIAPNWLVAEAPDLYLFGSLVEACAATEDDARLAMWVQRRNAIKQDMLTASRVSKRTAFAGMKVAGPTP